MITEAPATKALTISPLYLIPPSAIIGTPLPLTAAEASIMALSCGTPIPAIIRVVQILPGPTPTFMPSTPVSNSALAAAPVAILPAIISVVLNMVFAFLISSITPLE